MLIDSHCHLDFEAFDADREDVIGRSREAGIGFIVNVGSSLEGTKASLELAGKYDFIYAAAGIHPHEADKIREKELNEFESLLAARKIAAIGEIGLDYFKNFSSKENQKKLFIALLKVARGKNLPLIIHNRDAHEDTMSVLRNTMGGSVKGVMHCFSGDKTLLDECLDLGLHVSFTCNITFKKAENLRDVVREAPLERLLLETDAPFLAPQAFRGKRNEPSYLKFLAEKISEIKNVSFEEVAGVTSENAKNLFGLKGMVT